MKVTLTKQDPMKITSILLVSGLLTPEHILLQYYRNKCYFLFYVINLLGRYLLIYHFDTSDQRVIYHI